MVSRLCTQLVGGYIISNGESPHYGGTMSNCRHKLPDYTAASLAARTATQPWLLLLANRAWLAREFEKITDGQGNLFPKIHPKLEKIIGSWNAKKKYIICTSTRGYTHSRTFLLAFLSAPHVGARFFVPTCFLFLPRFKSLYVRHGRGTEYTHTS